MELEWKTCPIAVSQTVQETVAENPFDLELQLPEWAPDIRFCLRCTVTPQIQSVNLTADRAQAEGVGLLRVLYSAENGQPAVLEQTFPIRRSVPLPADYPQPQIFVGVSTQYVNCRASGQRKASVHGVIAIRFRLSRRQETPVLTGCVQPQVQTRGRTMQVMHTTAQTERIFAMSEVVELEGGKAPVGSIADGRAYVRIDATKAVQDKLLVKGEVTVQAAYLPADGSEMFAQFRHTMPLSQVIEAPGVTDTDLQDVLLQILSLELTPKSDGNGDNRLLDVALMIEASVRCCTPTSLSVIEDAYATAGDLQGKYTQTQFPTAAERWQDVFVCETKDAAGADLREIRLCTAGDVRKTVQMRDGMLEAQCETQIGLLGTDSDGALVWAEKTVRFACRKPMPDAADDSVICAPAVCVTQCSASLGADGAVTLRVEGFIDGTVYTLQSVRMLSEAVCTPIPDGRESAALTIYFADAGEPVWDIARAYRTTVEAVRTENALTEDVIAEKRMLVIPG